jgi:hypothetical protein
MTFHLFCSWNETPTAAWESSFVACNHRRKLLTIDDRKAICSGICHVLSSLPERQRGTSVMALALPSIGCLEAMVTYIGATTVDDVTKRKAALDRIAAEIVIVSTIARSFSNALWSSSSPSSSSANDNDDHLGERYFPPIADTALTILRRAWPSIQEVSTTHLHNEVSERRDDDDDVAVQGGTICCYCVKSTDGSSFSSLLLTPTRFLNGPKTKVNSGFLGILDESMPPIRY